MIGGKGHGGRMQGKSRERRLLAYHRDTPPVNEHLVGAGLLARGSLLLSGLPEAKVASVTLVGQRLAAYSCGGSAGIAPASLLAPGKRNPENLDTLTYRQRGARVNSA